MASKKSITYNDEEIPTEFDDQSLAKEVNIDVSSFIEVEDETPIK